MPSHIITEFIGTLVYVGGHHFSYSNAFITAGSLLVVMLLLGPYAGEQGLGLNPIASIVSYFTGEENFIQLIINIGVQLLAGVILVIIHKLPF